MIRTRKPVRLMEWGKGTNTTNQVWTVIGEGRISKHVKKSGLTQLTVSLDKPLEKQNSEDNSIKLTQQGEGMVGNSPQYWGEVGTGVLKQVSDDKRTVVLEMRTATKLDTRRHVPKWEEEGWNAGAPAGQGAQVDR